MNEDVKLDYSQTDRDLLRDTHANTLRTLDVLAAHTADDKERFDRTDARLDGLEKWQARISGIAGFLGFVAGIASRHIENFLTPLFR
jgi:hypothetical protein